MSKGKVEEQKWRCRVVPTLLVAFVAPVHATDLIALSLEQLLDVNIVGASKYPQKQSEVAAAVSVITRQEIQAFGWRTLGQALASLPGVYTTYDREYSYLGTRGLGLPGDLTARVLVTLNGNRVNDPVYDRGAVGREFPVDLDLIERIEFIPGPGGAVYGQNAMFGVVNVVTRQGADMEGAELAMAWQQPQAGREARLTWGKRLDNGVDVLLSVSGLQSRGEDLHFDFGAAGISGVAAGQDRETSQQLFARVASGPWSLDLAHGQRDKHDPTAAFFNDPLVPGQYNSDAYTLAQLQYADPQADSSLQVSGRLFMGRYRYAGQFSYNGGWFSYPAEGDWQGAEWRLLSTAVADHKWMLGLEAQDNRRTDLAALDLANPANNLKTETSGYRVGLYAQDEWRLSDTLTSTVGLRLDKNKAARTQSSPRAALIWQPTPATSLKALFGRAHRAPNVYERDYTDGQSQQANPALGSERIDTRELVLDHRVGTDLSLRTSLYRWQMLDLITQRTDPLSGLVQFHSGAPVTARGLELSADQTWARGARLRASLSAQNVVDASGAALPNSPRWLGKLNFSSPLPVAGWHLAYTLNYTSARLSLDGTQLGGQAVSNLHLGTHALAPGLALSLGVDNLFDKRYAHPGADTNWQNALVQDGRSVRFHFLYKF
jgi:outer membrane receptor protein involved in Fe transport